jgi:hypothetical protein
MAILKALTKVQIARMAQDEAKRAAKIAPPRASFTQAERAEQSALIASFAGKIEIGKVGKQLRATHWWQSDYRSFTPKGAMLKKDRERANGVHKMFSEE